ncbi:hypothetical protein PILCRDRAFT_549588 [Piloderma croceum F 1598]|uniref:Uncharacterized protein n=1 Tax=Piloderma croceum (strain F 1598) TaxID=765440 RepID=A0A0C3BQQ1_PILCF|nr:hypothetical protein PILCRDRAFT_549588 [Piloderma croceum F 1598]
MYSCHFIPVSVGKAAPCHIFSACIVQSQILAFIRCHCDVSTSRLLHDHQVFIETQGREDDRYYYHVYPMPRTSNQ